MPRNRWGGGGLPPEFVEEDEQDKDRPRERKSSAEVASVRPEFNFQTGLEGMLREARDKGCYEAVAVMASGIREMQNFRDQSAIFLSPTADEIEESESEVRLNALLDRRQLSEQQIKSEARRKAMADRQGGPWLEFNQEQSDWLRVIAVFKESLKQGVWEEALNKSEELSENGPFVKWCAEHQLNPKGLLGLARRLHADTAIDPAILGDRLDHVDHRIVSKMILSGLKDHLFASQGSISHMGEEGYLPVAIDTDGKTFKELGTVRGTKFTYYTADQLSALKYSFKGQKDLFGIVVSPSVDTRGNRLQGLHPISFDELREFVGDEFFEMGEFEEYLYNPHTGKQEKTMKVTCKGIDVVGRERPHFTMEEEISPEQAVVHFARMLATGKISPDKRLDLPFILDNTFFVSDFDEQYYKRSRGRIPQLPVSDKPREAVEAWLHQWYEKKLRENGNVCTIAAAQAIDDKLRLSADEFAPAEVLDELKKYYPLSTEWGGKEYPISYWYVPTDEYQERPEQYQATVNVKLYRDDIERIANDAHLNLPDVKIGSPGKEIQCVVNFESPQRRLMKFSSRDELQKWCSRYVRWGTDPDDFNR